MKYPNDIVNEDYGLHRIHKGHGLDRDMLLVDLEEHGDRRRAGDELVVREVYLRYVPRVKWCQNLDGWGCDDEGQWHSHWVEIKPHPDHAFTVVHWGDDDDPRNTDWTHSTGNEPR